MNLKLVYLTVPDKKTAKKITYALLEKRLIACANILDSHIAIYHWENEIKEEREHVVILKTQEKCVDSLMAELVQIHPYDTPCAIVLDPEKAHSEFCEWVEGQTS